MSDRILFVDDDPNILDSYRRTHRKRYEVDTALGPTAALTLVDENAYAVVVSDLVMPDKDGIEFLTEVRKRSPDTVRIMLTGNAELESSIAAVNEGSVFRFLTKPCPRDVMDKTLDAAVKQFRLVTMERTLLRDTLRGSISMLTDVLSNLRPEIYGRSIRISPLARRLAKLLDHPRPWEIETTAMLCQLGLIFVPEPVVKRVAAGKQLSMDEFKTYTKHVELGSELVTNIPRMEEIALSIRYQSKGFDGSGYPFDEVKGEDIPLGARIIKMLLEYDRLLGETGSPRAAMVQLHNRINLFDPSVLDALEFLLAENIRYNIQTVSLRDLSEGMFTMSEIIIEHGGNRIKALGKGQVITTSIIDRLKRLSKIVTITQEVKVIPKGHDTP